MWRPDVQAVAHKHGIGQLFANINPQPANACKCVLTWLNVEQTQDVAPAMSSPAETRMSSWCEGARLNNHP